MKGIVLAGGSGTRLYPTTKAISKQLTPIYNKPMIYYPLSALMLAGIRDILIITTPEDENLFERLLGNGEQFGIKISYAVQEKPEGLAQSFIIAENFIADETVALVLGDNIFYGHGFRSLVQNAATLKKGAKIFGYYVDAPHQYGVAELDKNQKVLGIEEKPKIPKSNYAVTGLYFYDNTVSARAKKLKPSGRGELEITDLNKSYLQDGLLSLEILGRGMAWLDTGTHDSLLEASNFVATIEKKQGLLVSCLEEIAYKMNFITHEQLLDEAEKLKKSSYGQYLMKIASGKT